MITRRDLATLFKQPKFLRTMLLLQIFMILLAVLLPQYVGRLQQQQVTLGLKPRVAVPVRAEMGPYISALEPRGFRFIRARNPDVLVRENDADLALVPDRDLFDVTVSFDSGRVRSQSALSVLLLNLRFVEAELRAPQGEQLSFVNIDAKNLAGPQGRQAREEGIGRFLPMLFLTTVVQVLSLGIGSIAIEKERRSFEPLLALPFSRLELIVGKAITSVIAGGAALLITLASIFFLAQPIVNKLFAGNQPLSFSVAFMFFIQGLATVSLFAAAGVYLACRAKTSAQAGAATAIFVIPLYALSLIIMAGADLVTSRSPLSFIPTVGSLLSVRDSVLGEVSVLTSVRAIAICLLPIPLLLRSAARMLRRDHLIVRPIE